MTHKKFKSEPDSPKASAPDWCLKFKYFPDQNIENYLELFKLKKGLYLVWLHLILKYVIAGQNTEI